MFLSAMVHPTNNGPTGQRPLAEQKQYFIITLKRGLHVARTRLTFLHQT